MNFMQLTLPPLLVMEVMSLLALHVNGKEAEDLSPMNGATTVAWAREETIVAEESIEEAISPFSFFSLLCELGLGIVLWSSIYNGINGGNKPWSDKRVENPWDYSIIGFRPHDFASGYRKFNCMVTTTNS